ncbi:predicted protein [Brucella suis bv. 3 str. 686]|nr:predicted protein [Brucella suis bv. 3 str. 686]
MNVTVATNRFRLANGFGDSLARGRRFLDHDDPFYADLPLERFLFYQNRRNRSGARTKSIICTPAWRLLEQAIGPCGV